MCLVGSVIPVNEFCDSTGMDNGMQGDETSGMEEYILGFQQF